MNVRFGFPRFLVKRFIHLLPICTAAILPVTPAFAQQATIEGSNVVIPIVEVGDKFYEVQLGITPNTNPQEFDLTEGYEITNAESEVESKSGVNGVWAISENVSPEACGADPYTDNYEIVVSRDGDDLSVTTADGEYSGTITGNSLRWEGTLEDNEGSVTTMTQVNFSPELNTLSGSSSWTLTVDDENCAGTTKISGQLTDPEVNSFTELGTKDPSMPSLISVVDNGASSFDGSVLHVPAVTVGDTNFWADLKLVDDNPIRFRLKEAGVSDVHFGLTLNQNTGDVNGAVFFSEGYGRAELEFDPDTGLLLDLIVDDEYYLFFNYTNTTVDVARLALGEATVFMPDIPLSEQGMDYVEQVIIEGDDDLNQEAFSLPRVFATRSVLRLELTDEEKEVKEKLEKARKAAEIALDVLKNAVEKKSYTVGEAAVDVLKDLTKDTRFKLLGYEFGEDVAKEAEGIFKILEAGATKFSCALGNLWSCGKYYLNKSETDKTLDDFYMSIQEGMDEVKNKVTYAHELRIARQVGCDVYYEDQAQIDECNDTLGAASGALEEVVDNDRDNDGTNDVQEADNGLEEIEKLKMTTDAIAAAIAASGETVSACTVGYKAESDGERKHYLDTDPESWWFGCFNSEGNQTGTWTEYLRLTGIRLTRTYRNGIWHGPFSSYYESNPTFETGNSGTGAYHNGEPDGTFLTYYQNVLVHTETYAVGVLHGPYGTMPTPFFDHGEMGQYANGKRDGDWSVYEDNKLYRIDTYVDGVKTKQTFP